VPEEVKDYLTNTFIKIRATTSKLQNFKHRYFVESAIERIENIDKIMSGNSLETIQSQEHGQLLLLENQFKKIKTVRLDFLSKSFEEIYLINKNMLKLKGELKLATEHNSTAEAAKLSVIIAENEVQISTQLNALSAWLVLEALDNSALLCKVNKNLVKNLISNDLESIVELQGKISELIIKFNTGDTDHSLLKSLSKIYLFGF
jgi:hypothetical protein